MTDDFVPTAEMLEMAERRVRSETERLNGLVAKAQALYDCLIDAERNHGGLVGTKTLRARDELGLELTKWKTGQ